MSRPPRELARLVERFDPEVFDVRRRARVRLEGAGDRAWDLVLGDGEPRLEPADAGTRPDAELAADRETWRAISEDLRAGMAAFRRGRLRVRRDLHLGVGVLAAVGGPADERRLRVRTVDTRVGEISTFQAGEGPPVLLVHGLGATKGSFLPTIAALAGSHRVISLDLPGFGDSCKPVLAGYDARFFARSVRALMDALGVERAALVGNSMGGRVAIEVGLRYPERVVGLALLAPSLAWLRDRPWAPVLRLVAPQLGLVQPAPRRVVEAVVRRLIPAAEDHWVAAGIDEFLRAYLTRRGRAAFYAAARNIYLEEPHGEDGFWTRLPELRPPSLWVWGRRDPLVPHAFARHVREALPDARHLVLPCGHVPQLERPNETHDAIQRFLCGLERAQRRPARRRASAASARA